MNFLCMESLETLMKAQYTPGHRFIFSDFQFSWYEKVSQLWCVVLINSKFKLIVIELNELLFWPASKYIFHWNVNRLEIKCSKFCPFRTRPHCIVRYKIFKVRYSLFSIKMKEIKRTRKKIYTNTCQ